MATVSPVQGQIEGTAIARFVRVSPQKARLVIDLIRGQRAEEALQTLRFTKKRIAKGGRLGGFARRRCPLRDALLRERGSALEAHAPRANGTRLPLSEAHQPH